MVLAVDIGNTSICLGIFDNSTPDINHGKPKLHFKSKLASDRQKSADEYAVLLAGIFAMNHIETEDIDGAMLLSVVPTITHSMVEALAHFKIEPLIVGSGIKTGLNIRIDSPNLLGADIVADTIAALQIKPAPIIVVDLGTATTLTLVNEKNELCGCIITPGVRLSTDAMSEKCALLPEVSLARPEKLLGTNTADSVTSGAVFGNALMLDGFIDRIRREYDFGDSLSVIATGGLSELIIPLCENDIIREPDLTLYGLFRLYQINTRSKVRGASTARK